MIIGSIILVLLGVMALIGIGSHALKDFNIPSLGVILVFATVVGLNFIPQMNLGNFYFSFGTALFFVLSVLLWALKGKMANRLASFFITVVLAGLVYGATRLSLYYGSTFWGNVNVFYALIVGALAFIATRNAKYGWVTAVLSIMTATLLTQIGGAINLDAAYSWSIVAGALAVTLFALVSRMVPARPGRLGYYFEAGRMLDD